MGSKERKYRTYELTDHLGNVTTTILDRKELVCSDDTFYRPTVRSWTDYYPFGYPMSERSWRLDGYRYGFNGQESDGEVYGEKLNYTAEFWQYDSRLGRRWNVDPKPNTMISPYACFANSPILFIDLCGDTLIVKNAADQSIFEKQLSEAFGEKNTDFCFETDGSMHYTGNSDYRKKTDAEKTDPEKLLEGIVSLIDNTKTFTLKYERNYSTDANGGGYYNPTEKTIVIDPITTYSYKEKDLLLLPKYFLGILTQSVTNLLTFLNTTYYSVYARTFHEIGEASLYPNIVEPSYNHHNVINYENIARKIKKTFIKGQYENNPEKERIK